MKQRFRELPEPLNANESFLHGLNERLDALIDLLSPKEEVVRPLTFKVPEESESEEKVEEVKPKRTRKTPAKPKEVAPKEE